MLPTRANVSKTGSKHPTQEQPSPPNWPQAPLVTVVEAKPVRGQNPPSRAQRTQGEGASGKRWRGEHPIPDDWTVNQANYEHGAKFYGYTRVHVKRKLKRPATNTRPTGMSTGMRIFARLCDGRTNDGTANRHLCPRLSNPNA